MNYEFDSFSSFLFIITAILVIINIAIIIAVLTGCGTDNTDNVEKTSPTTPKPTPNEPIDWAIEMVEDALLDEQPLVTDAAVRVEGSTAYIVILVACNRIWEVDGRLQFVACEVACEKGDPEIDRLHRYATTMAKVYLSDYGVNGALIGIYNYGGGQIQLEAETW